MTKIDERYIQGSADPTVSLFFQHLFFQLLSSILFTVSIVLVTIIIIKFKKYSGKDFWESISLQQSLLKTSQTPFQDKVNSIIKRATVEYMSNKIKIVIPNKLWWQPTSHIDLTNEVLKRIESREFKDFLSSTYPEYSFTSIIRGKNCYIIIGEM